VTIKTAHSTVDPDDRARRIARAYWFGRKLTIIAWLTIGVPSIVVGLTTSHDDLVFVPFVIGIPIVVQRFLIRRRVPAATVLWVRRFHRGYTSRREQIFLEYALTDWGYVVTLADSSVEHDAATRATSGWKYWLSVLALAMAGGIGYRDWWFAASILMAAGAMYAMRRLRTPRVLTTQDFQGLMKRVRKRTQRKWFIDSASIVLTCPQDSELWREAIDYLLPRSDAVIVSQQETSERLDWELTAAARAVGPTKMIGLSHRHSPTLPGMQDLPIPSDFGWWVPLRRWRAISAIVGSAILRPRIQPPSIQ
jgi:hypothetical protein